MANEKRKQKMSVACNINNDIRSSRDYVEYLRTMYGFAQNARKRKRDSGIREQVEWAHEFTKDRQNLKNYVWNGKIFRQTTPCSRDFFPYSLACSVPPADALMHCTNKFYRCNFHDITLARNHLFANNDLPFVHEKWKKWERIEHSFNNFNRNLQPGKNDDDDDDEHI